LPEGVQSPGLRGGFRPIKEEEDVDPRIPASSPMLLINCLASLQTQLMMSISRGSMVSWCFFFNVRWKTNETSCLPFSTMKLDFPCETAAYVLKHKVTESMLAVALRDGHFNSHACIPKSYVACFAAPTTVLSLTTRRRYFRLRAACRTGPD
jgi:hypothetical protein